MKFPLPKPGPVLNWLPPDVAEHFRCLLAEIKVGFVHSKGVRKCLREFKDAKHLKVNFGSGSAPKPGFLNLDYSPAADVRLDLRRPVPLPDSSCVLAYSEHFVEHLAYPEGAEGFFAECLRIIEPGGEISISVPDTEWPLVQYVERRDEWLRACEEHKWHPEEFNTYMEHINHHFRQRPRGESYSHFENHRFAWDFETLRKKLLETGFTDVARRGFDPALDSHHREIGSLFVKAVKPHLEKI